MLSSLSPRVGVARPAGVAKQRQARRPAAVSALPYAFPLSAALPAGSELASLATFALVGGLAAAVSAFALSRSSTDSLHEESSPPASVPVSDAVLVFGAGGRLGREAVVELLRAGRCVVAAARDAAKTQALLEETLTAAGVSSARLTVRGGVDVTNASTLDAQLYGGVTQVLIATGALFGKGADGKMGYIDGMTSEKVDAEGNANIGVASGKHLSTWATPPALPLLSFSTEEDLSRWRRMDDVIMGGRSSSTWSLATGERGQSVGRWAGEMVLEGGGFCGCRCDGLSYDLGAYDGFALRIKGDGQRLKLNVKTARNDGKSESTYQAVLDPAGAGIAPGEWGVLRVRWQEFVAVLRQNEEEGAPPLDPTTIRSMGLVWSRFEFNGLPNYETCKGGAFSLEIESVSAFALPRPQLVMLSSAGVERNARIGDDPVKRKADIPIVQLNPGGVLNNKYKGEWALRKEALQAGLTYSVLRPTGLDAGEEGARLELGQGDGFSGRVSRPEVARVAVLALRNPSAANATFELKRSESALDKAKSSTDAELNSAISRLVTDGQRTRWGIRPMPLPVEPPAPASVAVREAVFARSDVQASLAAGRGGRTRGVEDGDASTGAALPSNVVDAAQWIARWRKLQAAKARVEAN